MAIVRVTFEMDLLRWLLSFQLLVEDVGELTKLVVRIACGMNVLMCLLSLNCWSTPFAERKEHAHGMGVYSGLFLRFSYGAAVNFFLVVCRRDCRA